MTNYEASEGEESSEVTVAPPATVAPQHPVQKEVSHRTGLTLDTMRRIIEERISLPGAKKQTLRPDLTLEQIEAAYLGVINGEY